MVTVANIGAGTGSYEPSSTVVAVEPSKVMIRQRSDGAAPVVRAVAEHLPISANAVDAALAVLTIHHWSDVDAGVAEMIRVARRRVVILTWDDTVFRQFSMLALTAEPLLREGLSRLEADLATGAWTDRHADLLDKPQLDLGYRLVVSDLEPPA